MNRKILTTVIVCVALLATAAAASDKYPHRGDYPDVPTIETSDLFDGLRDGTILVVDVRSRLEFDVIHVTDAEHVPVSKQTFEAGATALAEKNPGKTLVFYCNGTTCLKAYKATEKAMYAGLSNVAAYDSGIPEWANTFPGETQLLSATITDPATQLISKSAFKDKCMVWEAFQAKGGEAGVMVIDVRDHIQKSGDLPGLDGPRGIPLDKFIPNFVAKKANQDKTLLIFDQVGKQIKWLQYYLEKYGYTNYYFLEGGATKVLKRQEYRS